MYSEALPHFVDLVKQKSGGRLIIDTFPAAALIPAGKAHEGATEGTVQMCDTTGAYLVGKLPLGEISYGLPASPLNAMEWYETYQNLGIKALWKEAVMKTYGMVFITPCIVDPEGFLLRKPFTDLASLKGRKVRIAGGFKTKVVQEAMGMLPVMISRAEVETALALGTVDGGITAIGTMYDMKWHEPAPNFLANMYMFQAGEVEYMANAAAYNALPDDLKKALSDAGEEHALWSAKTYCPARIQTALDGYKKANVTFTNLPANEVQAIRDFAVTKVWTEIAAKDTYAAQAIKIITDYSKKLGYLK